MSWKQHQRKETKSEGGYDDRMLEDGKKIEEDIVGATAEDGQNTESKGGDDDRIAEDGKKIEEDIMRATAEDEQRTESKGGDDIQEGTEEVQSLWS